MNSEILKAHALVAQKQCYNLSCHRHVESAFLFLFKQPSICTRFHVCDKHEKRQVGGFLIRGTMPRGVYPRTKPAHNIKTCPHGATPSRTCKICNHERFQKWEQENVEKIREKKRIWNEVNSEKIREFMKIWTQTNADKIREKRKEYRQNNLEKVSEGVRKWKQANRKKVYEHNQARRSNKRGKGSFTTQEWRNLKEFYGYKCLACGRYEPEIKLTPDHVKPLKLGGINSIENIQPLCEHCNYSKGAKHIDYRNGRIMQ